MELKVSKSGEFVLIHLCMIDSVSVIIIYVLRAQLFVVGI